MAPIRYLQPSTFNPQRSLGADLPALGLLFLLTLLYYPGLVFAGLILADYDAFVYFFPLRQYAVDAIQAGYLPMWNSDAFLGSPFLANPQTSLFYPLTALFYLAPVPYAYSASLVVHQFLAGAFFYLFARRTLGLAPVSGLFGALAFMFGGFFAGQAGHLNQLSAAAWLPLMVVAFDEAARRRSLGWIGTGGLVLGVQLLAGHPQVSYMSLAVAGLWVVGRALIRKPRRLGWAVGTFVPGAALGLGVASIQLLPTLELTRDSVRAGGLDYRHAVFGSLPPWEVPRGLLPGFQWHSMATTEWLGYVGVIPLAAALLALVVSRHWAAVLGLTLATLGFILALGEAFPAYELFFEYAPFFDRFRVPARWLLVYIFGVAVLAALGVEWVRAGGSRFEVRGSNGNQEHRTSSPAHRTSNRRPRTWNLEPRTLLRVAALSVLLGFTVYWYLDVAEPVPRRLIAAWLVLAAAGGLLLFGIRRFKPWAGAMSALLVLLAAAELWLAPAALPYRYPVPPDAYQMDREVVRYLQDSPPGRVLSVATDNYELRETPDYARDLAWLDSRSLIHYLVALKYNETLSPNLSMVYDGLASADGYDGGVLPMDRFVEISSLVMPPEVVRDDGVWRSRLWSVPSPRLLDLLGVQHVIASNIRDAVVDGVPHDRALLVPLGRDERHSLRRLPDAAATALGMVVTYDGPDLEVGTEVGQVTVRGADGTVREMPIRLGAEVGYEDEPPEDGTVASEPLERWAADGWDYHLRWTFDAVRPAEVEVRSTAVDGVLKLAALTLIDDVAQRAYPLVLDDRFQRAAFFDLKVYTLVAPLPRAYFVQRASVLDQGEALGRLGDPSFDPRSEVVLAPDPGARSLDGSPEAVAAEVDRSRPERIVAQVSAPADGYLVITEAWAPGWEARVNGEPVPVVLANHVFQAVPLEAGEHVVELGYEAPGLRVGAALSLVSLAIAIVLFVVGRRRPTDARL